MNAPVAPSEPSLVPKSAQRDVAEANRLIEEQRKQQGQPPARAEWVTPPHTPPVQPGVPEPPQPPGPSAEAVAAAVAAADPQHIEEENRRLRAAYQTLQGKYNQEIAGLRAVSLQQGELINSIMAERNKPAPPPPVNQTPEEMMRSLGATDKDIEDYGELLPIVAKLAQNMFRPTLAKLEGELAQLRNQHTNTANTLVKTRQAEVEYDLDQALPNWRVINESQEFLDWLDITDIMAGTTRRVALASAYKNLDAQRVVGIFQAYVREYPGAKAASNGPLVPIDTLLAPTQRGDEVPTAPESASSKRIISEQEIADFYTRVRKRQVSPEEYQRYSREIAVATAEGRIRPSRPDHHLNSA